MESFLRSYSLVNFKIFPEQYFCRTHSEGLFLSTRICFILGDSANGAESQQDQGIYCISVCTSFSSSKEHNVRKIKSDKIFIHCIRYFGYRLGAYLQKQSPGSVL